MYIYIYTCLRGIHIQPPSSVTYHPICKKTCKICRLHWPRWWLHRPKRVYLWFGKTMICQLWFFSRQFCLSEWILFRSLIDWYFSCLQKNPDMCENETILINQNGQKGTLTHKKWMLTQTQLIWPPQLGTNMVNGRTQHTFIRYWKMGGPISTIHVGFVKKYKKPHGHGINQ